MFQEYKKTGDRSRLLRGSRVKKYLFNFWNILDLLSYIVLVIALFLRHLCQVERQIYARNMFSLSLLILYLRFLEVFLIFKSTGTTIIMIIEMVPFLFPFNKIKGAWLRFFQNLFLCFIIYNGLGMHF